MPNLTIMTGEQAGTSFQLANRPLSVGRDPSRDIQILDLKVSRKHAIIRNASNSHAIAPTKAMNGLQINGEPIEAETVHQEGDEITMGNTVLRFSREDSSDYTDAVNVRKVADRQARDAKTLM